MPPGFIAVHVGAGYHGEQLRRSYAKTCKRSCSAAVRKLKTGCSAIEAVVEAVSVLEDCPLTNAGVGSNLTLNGTVECDAAVMDGQSLAFGSVGALSNIRNPVKVAQKVLIEQNKGLLPFGRVPPCTLAGGGALEWAVQQGFQSVPNEHLLTRTTQRTYLKNLRKIQSKTADSTSFLPDQSDDANVLLDTVGALCIDSYGNVASAVSSGGLLVKFPGRIGQAAVYGSGCWAQNSFEVDKPSTACTATGVGEYLIRTSFAEKCCGALYDNHGCITALRDVFKTRYLESPFLRNVSTKSGGVLALKYYSQDKMCELSWAHNTETMILGYANLVEKPTCVISMHPGKSVFGQSIFGSECCVRL